MKNLLLLSLFPSLMCGQIASAGGQTVPVPGQIQQPIATSITVEGEIGASQAADIVKIVRLQLDAKGNIKRATGTASPEYKVGQEVPVESGSYIVDYSHTSMMVEIAPNEHKVIELQKISVPRIDGSYTVKVFTDYTNRIPQEQLALWTYVQGVSLTVKNETWESNRWGQTWDDQTTDVTKDLAEACKEAKSSLKTMGKKICAAYATSDYRNMIGADYVFNSDGSYAVNSVTFNDDPNSDNTNFFEESETVVQEGREYNANGIDGDFFSLLPGTYGLEYKNAAGKVSSQLGIQLQ